MYPGSGGVSNPSKLEKSKVFRNYRSQVVRKLLEAFNKSSWSCFEKYSKSGPGFFLTDRLTEEEEKELRILVVGYDYILHLAHVRSRLRDMVYINHFLKDLYPRLPISSVIILLPTLAFVRQLLHTKITFMSVYNYICWCHWSESKVFQFLASFFYLRHQHLNQIDQLLPLSVSWYVSVYYQILVLLVILYIWFYRERSKITFNNIYVMITY